MCRKESDRTVRAYMFDFMLSELTGGRVVFGTGAPRCHERGSAPVPVTSFHQAPRPHTDVVHTQQVVHEVEVKRPCLPRV
jgi:hypothetical protein